MIHLFVMFFAGCFISEISASYKILDEENSRIDLFLREIKVDTFPEHFGINVTWHNLNDSSIEGSVFLVEYKEAASKSYSRLLTDNRYKYVFNLEPRTTYVFCVHLGNVVSSRLLEKNCRLGTTTTPKMGSSFEKSVILASISSLSGLILGFLIGYFYKRYRMLNEKKEVAPPISPRPFWTLNGGRSPSYDPSNTSGTASYITVQDYGILRNLRKKSQFVKNDVRTQRILRYPKMANVRYSLPNIGATRGIASSITSNTNTYLELIADGNDYESIKYESHASSASVMTSRIDRRTTLRRLTSLYEVRPEKTSRLSPTRRMELGDVQIDCERL